jgi:sec-independent protein translocase protein TatB
MGTIFGFGAPELIVIALLVLVLFKPENLPGMFRSFGNNLRKFRNWYVNLAGQIRQELEPVHEELKEIRQVAHDVRNDLEEIRSAVDLRAMLPAMDDEPPALPAPPDAAKATETAMPGSHGEAPSETPNTGMGEPVMASVEHGLNGNVHADNVSEVAPVRPAKTTLPKDNPWAGGDNGTNSGKPKLAEDNPWSSA